jgi:hypothetical protein
MKPQIQIDRVVVPEQWCKGRPKPKINAACQIVSIWVVNGWETRENKKIFNKISRKFYLYLRKVKH